jgi:hypothetical protein
MAKFVLATERTKPEPEIALSFEKSLGSPNSFEIIAELPSGRKVRLGGFETQRSNGKLVSFRWGGYTNDTEINEYVEINTNGRVTDRFPDE